MPVHVHLSPVHWRSRPASYWNGQTCVVIDALRATSTIVTALAHGANAILPVREVDDARRLAHGRANTLLAGERGGLPPEGFALSNSPRAFTREVVQGKDIVLTTTNGTDALTACANASTVWIASMLNLSAVADAMRSAQGPVHLLCAGTGDDFSMEDGYVAAHLLEAAGIANPVVSLNALGSAREVFGKSVNGRRLISLGLEADVDWCAQTDLYDFVPRLLNGKIQGSTGILPVVKGI
jgi:2-phosphosulfolactate phosphatase